MQANLGYNKLTVKDNSVNTNIPDNDVARLMYYLNCVSCVLKYNGFSQYTNYNAYYLLSNEDKINLLKLAILFNPDIMMEVGVFVKLEDLDCANRFFEITDEEMKIHANREIVIGGIKTNVLKIMLFKSSWADRNYYSPKNRLTEEILNPNKKTRRKSRDESCCSIF